jgi:hypothetical protein
MIINRIKLKIAEIETAEIKEYLYYIQTILLFLEWLDKQDS